MRRSRVARAGIISLLFWFLVLPTPEAARAQQLREEEPPQLTLERALIERGGLLLKPGQFEIEPSLEYSRFSTRRINVSGFSILPTIIIGVIETEKVERDVLDASLTGRIGLFKNFQAEIRVPYRFINDTSSTETRETTESNSAIGDVEVGLFCQVLRESKTFPFDVILGARGKTITGDDPFGDPEEPPTGTGFYSVTGSITGVKIIDPAAIFASILYTHNFERTVRVRSTDPFETEIEPGDSIGYNLGLALAINPELSFNFRVEQRFVRSTHVKSQAPGSSKRKLTGSRLNVAVAFLGFSWGFARNASLDFSAGLGLTEDSPDVTIRFAVPVRFSLW